MVATPVAASMALDAAARAPCVFQHSHQLCVLLARHAHAASHIAPHTTYIRVVKQRDQQLHGRRSGDGGKAWASDLHNRVWARKHTTSTHKHLRAHFISPLSHTVHCWSNVRSRVESAGATTSLQK